MTNFKLYHGKTEVLENEEERDKEFTESFEETKEIANKPIQKTRSHELIKEKEEKIKPKETKEPGKKDFLINNNVNTKK